MSITGCPNLHTNDPSTPLNTCTALLVVWATMMLPDEASTATSHDSVGRRLAALPELVKEGHKSADTCIRWLASLATQMLPVASSTAMPCEGRIEGVQGTSP